MQQAAAAAIPVRPARIAPAVRRRSQPTEINAWSQAGSRMLVSTFFLISAVTNMGGSDPTGQFDAIIDTEASLIFNAVIYSMAFALLVGRYVHIAAISLGLIMLLSASNGVLQGTQNIQEYWKDLAIVGALFALAVSQGGNPLPAIQRMARSKRTVTPRRVTPPATVIDMVDGHQRRHETRNHIARPVGPAAFVSRRST